MGKRTMRAKQMLFILYNLHIYIKCISIYNIDSVLDMYRIAVKGEEIIQSQSCSC